MTEWPSTRDEARRLGVPKYFTGKPCKHGHLAPRLVSSPQCDECRIARRATAETKQYMRAYRLQNIERMRASDRRKRGIPDPTRPAPANCEICGRPDRNRVLSADHCHDTDRFRGWLCGPCNTWLGRCGDNLDGLERWTEAAQRYLRRSQSQ